MGKSEKWCGCLALRTAAIAWGVIAFLSSVAGMLYIFSFWYAENEKYDEEMRSRRFNGEPNATVTTVNKQNNFSVWEFLLLRTYSIYISLLFYQKTYYTMVHGYANRRNSKSSSVKFWIFGLLYLLNGTELCKTIFSEAVESNEVNRIHQCGALGTRSFGVIW